MPAARRHADISACPFCLEEGRRVALEPVLVSPTPFNLWVFSSAARDGSTCLRLERLVPGRRRLRPSPGTRHYRCAEGHRFGGSPEPGSREPEPLSPGDTSPIPMTRDGVPRADDATTPAPGPSATRWGT